MDDLYNGMFTFNVGTKQFTALLDSKQDRTHSKKTKTNETI